MKITTLIVLFLAMLSYDMLGQTVVSTEYIKLLSTTNNNTYKVHDHVKDDLYLRRPASFETLIPTDGSMVPQSFERVDVFAQDAKAATASGASFSIKNHHISYRSKGSMMSILTIDANEVRLNCHHNATDYILEEGASVDRILSTVAERDPHEVGCATSDNDASTFVKLRDNYKISEAMDLRLSLHIDYQLYLDNGSEVQATIAWVNDLFSQVATLFAVHNINLQISELLIWDIPDPYQNIPGLNEVLPAFGEEVKDNFIGDVAQLLTGRSIGGGKANLDKLCQPYQPLDHSGPYAVSASIDIDDTQSTSYSFSTYVTAHEIGHVVGSPHTHACAWGPTHDTSLDNCFAPEGSCSLGPATNNGGSIMSYCFLNPHIGINYDHGFGEEPGALMYAKIYNSSCNDCLVGQACDDGDSCTMDDQLDAYCNCVGVFLDHNMNNICDLTEPCKPIVNADTISNTPIAVLASNMIKSSTNVNDINTFSSGQAAEFYPGFQVDNNKIFQVYNSGCVESGNP